MYKYNAVEMNGDEVILKKEDYIAKLRSGNYERIADGGVFILCHKGNPRAIAAYKALHNFNSNEWGKLDRLSRCLDEKGNICKENCRKCDRERESRVPVSLEEREETGVQHPNGDSDVLSKIIEDEFIAEMRSVLHLLEIVEARVIEALYGLNEPAVSLTEYAESEGLKYSTARSHRDRAMKKLPELAAHLKDYL